MVFYKGNISPFGNTYQRCLCILESKFELLYMQSTSTCRTLRYIVGSKGIPMMMRVYLMWTTNSKT
jgi:hypothetical protein